MNTFGVLIFNKDSMIIFFNREEEFNMRGCPEAANHSRYLAWDMQVLEEQSFVIVVVALGICRSLMSRLFMDMMLLPFLRNRNMQPYEE